MNLQELPTYSIFLNESAKPSVETKKKIKGLFKLKAKQFNQLNDFIYYDKSSKQWFFITPNGNLVEIRNEKYLKDIKTYIKKNDININD